MMPAAGRLRGTDAYRKTLAALGGGAGTLRLGGLWGGSQALLLSCLAEDLARPLAAVTSGVEEADALAADLALFGRDAEPFPAGAATQDPLDPEGLERLRVLARLAHQTPPAVVFPAVSLLSSAPAPDSLRACRLSLRAGQAVSPQAVVQTLAAAGLERAVRVESPGQFARRGGILDCFLPPLAIPVRVEWEADTVLSLRAFDPTTQSSTGTLDEVEWLLPGGGASGRRVSPLEHLAAGALVALTGPAEIRARLETLAADAARPFDWGPDRVRGDLERFQRIEMDALSGDPGAIRFPVRTLTRFEADLPSKMRALAQLARSGAELLLYARRDAERDRFAALSKEHGLDWGSRLARVEGILSQGFELAGDPPLVLVSYDEVFYAKRPRWRAAFCRADRAIQEKTQPIDDFGALTPGDLMIHEAHGVAIYRGLEILERGGARREHLKIEFAAKTVLYVPVQESGLVSRYVGSGGAKPTLSRLGGIQWAKTKKAAAEATQEFAKGLVGLQALRTLQPAARLLADEELTRQFAAAFPYAETLDQLAAADKVAQDLASDKPMDRLLTGDVGFGKTEIAMRAAFAAAASGHQTAVLVPTTVLAMQHLASFRDRLAPFAVRVEMVSRLVPKKEQARILKDTRTGKVDVLIGTHRLLQKDVAFADLGLVVIDEEQKFGVAAKQKLKSLRASAHVLSLSATPIPRTLHMALLGLKEISSLATPPVDRHAIHTHVGPYDERLVQEAVRRELAREGQVFFVHNRIAGLDPARRMLAKRVPEARVGVGHGRLKPRHLEKVMLDFMARRDDILVSTTIIEAGLDLQNVNTLIVSDAQRYGLAELHQLRGRVGRFKRQAYAYCLFPAGQPLPPQAVRRLKAIEEHSELGAGFQIALQDLEIRGAGNLLGPEQSGHLAAIGYDLYCRLLDEAVKRLKGERRERPAGPALIRLRADAYLPESYAGGPQAKLEIYRRLSRARSAGEIDAVEKEIADRFGRPPPETRRLLDAARLSVRAGAAGIVSIEEKGKSLLVRFAPGADHARILKGMRAETRSDEPDLAILSRECLAKLS